MGVRRVALVALILTLAACGDGSTTATSSEPATVPVTPSSAAPSTTTAPAPTGRLRVTQNQTGCCYVEGQVSYLTVSGATTTTREFQSINPIMPVVDLDLAPGPYTIESNQRPCNGNCDMLGPPTDQCNLSIDLAGGDSMYFTVEFAPSTDCTITQTETPLRSPVPDEFAFREPYPDCAIDYSLMMPGGHPGLERSCLLDANAAGQTAELSAYEAGAVADSPDFLVYRTNADRTIEVFLPNLDRPTDGPWRHYTCTGLEPDEAHGFVTVGCSDPVELGIQQG